MNSFVAALSLACLVSSLGCAHTSRSAPRDRFIEVKDDRLASSPYIQEIIEKVRAQWDPASSQEKDKIYSGTIITVEFSIALVDGSVRVESSSATGQLLAQIMCATAVRRAAPFGPVPKEIAPKSYGAQEMEMALVFHF